MTKNRLTRSFVFGSVLLLAFGVSCAFADQIYTLNVPNAAMSGFTGPFATATVHLVNSTHATVTFDGLDNGGFYYLIGDGSEADVNVNATSFSIAGISGTNSFSGFIPGPYSTPGPGNVSSFGAFNAIVDGFDGFTHSATEVTYTLTDLSGTWAGASNVLTPNASGYSVAVHSFACQNPCNTAEGAASTGLVGNGASPVPEPATVSLFGLAGLVALIYRSRKQTLTTN
jgi:hypothetical protein